MSKKFSLIGLLLLSAFSSFAQKQWTLQECIDYALEHNIQLQQNVLQKQSASEDVAAAKGQLLPDVSFSTSQNLGYRPFPEGGGTTVTNGYVDNKVSKTTYNGMYGINANWTVWNGNKNTNTVKQNQIAEQQAELTAEQTANSIQEQIAQLYVQILYNTEGLKVYQQIVDISKANLSRGQEMMRVGSMAKAEVAQLEAQVATDEYNLVNAQGQISRYKMQLKQLLEIPGTEDFDIAQPTASDEQALQTIPSMADTYNNAVLTRPELKSAQLGVESSELGVKIAKAGYMPTIGVNGSIGASTTSASDNTWGKQMKSNLNGGLGVSLSMPLFDGNQTKTSVNKAKIQLEEQKLQLANTQKELWNSVEGYWIDATTNQARFKAAKVSTDSAQESFNLVSEQFNEGLKNIQELTTGKETLINAEQQRLESKYTTILNIQLLKFYNGDKLTL